MYDTWKDVMRQCAESIYSNEQILGDMAAMGLSAEYTTPALATLHAQLELMQSLVSAYLEEIRQ